MTMRVIVCVVFIIYGIFQRVSAAPVFENFDSMEWEEGDIITCRLNGFWGMLFAKHFMLASDDNSVINVVGDKSTHDGTILKQKRIKAHGFDRSKCSNRGKGKLPVTVALERAQNWLNRNVYYDLIRCNCQHWVKYWTDGTSGGFFENQSGLPTNKKCAI
ncbi:hypothetical protein WA026_017451 [Henosepilachna vigintioctopunctata]|uniref:LRAT domain-containing protein n=1 Tax=Henosepilachna vigintioctopunctata TaxID=420089 RepID=A0AAW1V9W0_9CUCU